MRGLILGPAHHRLHHACNPEYIDKNFWNFLGIWDRLFGTYQDTINGVPPRYGIARPIDAKRFFDVYFSEFVHLWHDMKNAPTLSAKCLYAVMPPGWRYGQSMASCCAHQRGRNAGLPPR